MPPWPPETPKPVGRRRLWWPRRAARRRDPSITMSTMQSERHSAPGVEPDGHEPPQEVVDRLAELLPEGALDDAVRGLRPEELSGPGGAALAAGRPGR